MLIGHEKRRKSRKVIIFWRRSPQMSPRITGGHGFLLKILNKFGKIEEKVKCQLYDNHFRSYSPPVRDSVVFFQCVRMRLMIGVRLCHPFHCEFLSWNCLNKLGFNYSYLRNNHFPSNLHRFQHLSIFFRTTRVCLPSTPSVGHFALGMISIN